jgi:hypothetical protein
MEFGMFINSKFSYMKNYVANSYGQWQHKFIPSLICRIILLLQQWVNFVEFIILEECVNMGYYSTIFHGILQRASIKRASSAFCGGRHPEKVPK